MIYRYLILFFLFNDAELPKPLIGLTVTQSTVSSITLSWMWELNENYFAMAVVVRYVTIANFKVLVSKNVTLTEKRSGYLPSMINITGLEPLTLYYYSVTVVNTIGVSEQRTIQVWTFPLSE